MKLRLFPITVTALLSCIAVPAAAQDFFCFMESTSGQVIDLTGLCAGGTAPSLSSGTPTLGSAPATSFEPVGANLAITRGEGDYWRVIGLLVNQTQARMDILGVQFDVLDAEGTLLYTDVLVPSSTGFGPGQDRLVTHRIPMSRFSGTPASVVPTQSRYVQN
ncbi:MAG: hypothetical protein RLZZ597_1581 [Cyanobacteriota bacterium]|jgi:hypothetical protein